MVFNGIKLQNKLHIFKSAEEVSEKLADKITSDILRILKKQKRITLLLSGGTTPKRLYEILASKEIPWKKIHLFLSDERYVEHTDPDSNILMIKKAFEEASISPENFHPIPTHFENPEEAAKAYETEIKEFFNGDVQFDINILGIGEDGHTASLFPNNKTLLEKKRFVVVSCDSPKPPPTRITLTLPALNSSSNIYFLVTGKGKMLVLKRIFEEDEATQTCPTKGIDSKAEWWIDTTATSLIS